MIGDQNNSSLSFFGGMLNPLALDDKKGICKNCSHSLTPLINVFYFGRVNGALLRKMLSRF
jgi:hypothetical protein